MSNGNKDLSDLGAAAAALSVEDRSSLVNALKDKIQKLAGEPEILETLTPKIRKRVEYLRELQSQHDALKAKFVEERKILEAKYEKLYEPLYTKRSGVVIGTVEVDGITNEEKKDEGDKETEEKGVPSFWLTALKKNEVLAEEITELDEEALKYLKDITCCRLDDPKGFKLTFTFDPNPFFKNNVLTKTYQMLDEEDEILEKATGTVIEWLPGKCLTQKVLKKKPRKGSKNTKPITKTENCESFFHFFNPPQIPDDDDEEDIDGDVAEELEDRLEQDYDIGSTIREDIIPRAVSWYTGEAAHDDEHEHEDADGDDDEDENEDDEEDDEEEDKTDA